MCSDRDPAQKRYPFWKLGQDDDFWHWDVHSIPLGHHGPLHPSPSCSTSCGTYHSVRKAIAHHPQIYKWWYKPSRFGWFIIPILLGYSLWWTNIAMENHHAINGKIHYKWQFSIAMLVHQRVVDSFSLNVLSVLVDLRGTSWMAWYQRWAKLYRIWSKTISDQKGTQ